ncbi:hypothetical protein Rctr197k_026 [Virus Rctr197k]|nr:hypothetical protein Rctr197k_026 [Virus Rctr197k]
MSQKGLFILFGPPGGGKSTEAAATFPESIYLMSSPNILQFYENNYLTTPEAKARSLKMPKRVLCIDQFSIDGKVEKLPNGLPKPVAQKATLETYLDQVVVRALQTKSENQPPPWKNLIIDETGTFWSRVHMEIEPTVTTRSGAVDTRGGYGVLARWSRNRVDYLRQLLVCGMNVVFVGHDQEPDPTQERKGGPKMPSQGVMREMCADADAVLLRGFEDREIGQPSARVWLAHGRQNWITKIRGLPDSMFTQIKDWSLHQLVTNAGFEP